MECRQTAATAALARLGEIAATVDGRFEVAAVRNDRDDYARTCRVWLHRLKASRVASLELKPDEVSAALNAIPAAKREALGTAAARIRDYHERQSAQSWSFTEPDGTRLGQIITPLDRVGIYVPGGRAAYPSTVLMNALPAHVAGVAEIVMVVPTPGGVRNPLVLAAAGLAGVTRVFTIGGAQVSELHSNFLINLGGASAADIETLGETVRQRVITHSGVDLEWERILSSVCIESPSYGTRSSTLARLHTEAPALLHERIIR